MRTFLPVFLTIVSTLVTLAGCGGNPYRNPQATVHEMYAAISEGDTGRYMDAILPSNRQRPNPMGLLSAISVGFGAGGLSLGADLSELFRITVHDLELQTLVKRHDYSLIEARGKFRYPILMIEMEFCEQHDLRRENGRWYVDVYAPEKEKRMQVILQQHERGLTEQMGSGPRGDSLEEGLQYLAQSLLLSLETSLDLCAEPLPYDSYVLSSEELVNDSRCTNDCHTDVHTINNPSLNISF